MMSYSSTRGQDNKINFVEAMLNGLAADGGLYVPDKFPKFSRNDLKDFSQLSYSELAFEVTKQFVDSEEISLKEYKEICKKTYSDSFGKDLITYDKLNDKEFILNLYNGPTFAFKDFALQLLGNLYDLILKKRDTSLTIIGATSGDTGSAAICGCEKAQNVKIFILFPLNKVSEVQRKQMTTNTSSNVFNIAVRGNFDDCQRLVKKFFNLNNKIKKYNLAAVNSINWVRIMGQIVYYFWSYLKIETNFNPINYVVPTGNFGNVYAGFVSKIMGLPLNKLIVSSNRNDILTRFFQTGIMQKKKVVKSLSPSMDIQVSSNFERLVHYVSKDSKYTREVFEKLERKDNFEISKKYLDLILKDFEGGCLTDSETQETLKNFHTKFQLIIDPHTAVGYAVGKKILNESEKRIYLSTAHYAKFIDTVKTSIDNDINFPESLSKILDKKEKFKVIENSLEDLNLFISNSY